MSYSSLKQDYSKEHIDIIEIELDYCSLTHGTLPCTATETGDDKCYNCLETCNDVANYTKTTKIYRFCTPRSPHPIGIDAIPIIENVSVTPSEIDIRGGLGGRANINIRFMDIPHSDIDIDPYLSDRTYTPLDRGTFWTKLRSRNPNYQYRPMRHLSGYLVDGEYISANFETRHYVIEKLNVSQGSAAITGKDPLKLASGKKALMPSPNSGKLSTAITSTATTATLTPSGVGNDEYPTSGYLTIDKETMSFTRSGDTLTLTRAQYNTEAKAHNADATVQVAYQKNDQVHEIVYDALVTYAGIDSSFVSTSAWQSEVDTYLSGLLDGIITKPMDVNKVLRELADDMPHYLWWDEKQQLIQLTALKSPPETANTLNMDNNFIEDSVVFRDEVDMRISTVFVHYGQINPNEKINEPSNFEQTYARIDTNSISKYGSSEVKVVYSRWINNSNTAAARQLAALYGRRFADIPRAVEFKLDPKDSDLWIGVSRALNHRQLTDFSGSPVDIIFQIISASEGKNQFAYKGLEYTYGDSLPEDEGGGDPGVDLVIISSDEQNLNLRTRYDSLYTTPDATTVAKFVVEAGVVVGSSSTGTNALETGSWPTGATITLQINSGGYVVGAGGDGASTTASAGGAGGDAINMGHDMELINNGTIGGGGGGGGAGDGFNAEFGSSASGDGGGGAGNDVGTSVGGSNGTLENGGAGQLDSNNNAFAKGGDGGDLGQAGDTGVGNDGTSAGGAAGNAINKNGYTLTQTTAGDIRGTVA